MCSTDVLAQEVLVPEASEFDEWEPEGAALEGPVTAIIPTWQALTTLDLSHNSISKIDESVVCSQQWALGFSTRGWAFKWLFFGKSTESMGSVHCLQFLKFENRII